MIRQHKRSIASFRTTPVGHFVNLPLGTLSYQDAEPFTFPDDVLQTINGCIADEAYKFVQIRVRLPVNYADANKVIAAQQLVRATARLGSYWIGSLDVVAVQNPKLTHFLESDRQGSKFITA
jgi:hypothetical protein